METTTLLQLATTLVLALESDPFFRALTPEVSERFERRPLLHDYFAHALHVCADQEAFARCVRTEDGRSGVALWLLPNAQGHEFDADARRHFVRRQFGAAGFANYDAMTTVMSSTAKQHIPENAWHLALIGVEPQAQGRGLERELLEATLAEASAVHAPCYLETFAESALPLYRQCGFDIVASPLQPTAGARYWLLLRA